MQNNLVKIDIVGDESLLKACDLLHDGHCDLSTMEYDEKQGTLKATFEREFFENPALAVLEPKYFFLLKVIFPLASTELFLEGIKTYRIHEKSNIQLYSFNECEIKNSTYTFHFNEDMRIDFTFKDKPKGTLVDKALLNKKGYFYKFKNPFKKYHRLG